MANKEYIYLPNEIFADLHQAIDSSQQRSFAFCYYYYITYLYRYCRFIDAGNNKMTQDKIKEVLGYNPINKKVNFIIKKGGVLDTIGYTETTTDYPMTYGYEDDNEIDFFTSSYFKHDADIAYISTNDRNFKIKKPLKAFHRTPESMEDNELDGTFYNTHRTFRVNHIAFLTCMFTKELQTFGFFLYCYIKMKEGIYQEAVQKSFERIALELDISKRTAIKYTQALERHGLLYVAHSQYIHGADDRDKQANKYRTRK